MFDLNPDKETLAAIFEARINLAKKSLEQAVADVHVEYTRNLEWVNSDARKRGSFLWMCEIFDMEPSSVRRKVLEGRNAAV